MSAGAPGTEQITRADREASGPQSVSFPAIPPTDARGGMERSQATMLV